MRYLDSCWFVLLLSSTQAGLAQVLRPPHQQKWQQIQTPTEPQIQTQEVYRLLDRIQNNLSSHFLISIESQVTVFKNPPQKSHILHQCEYVFVYFHFGAKIQIRHFGGFVNTVLRQSKPSVWTKVPRRPPPKLRSQPQLAF